MHIAQADLLLETAPPAGGIDVAVLPLDAPWAWLAAGWRDLCAAPLISLSYGGTFAGVAALLTGLLASRGMEALILPLCGGFLLLGPALAVGLYETSRRLEVGESVAMGAVLRAVVASVGRVSFFGAILAFVYAVWLQLAFLLLMLFLGSSHLPPAKEFVPTLLFTSKGLGLLVTGTVAGGALALLVFAISVVSVPLLMMRKLDAVTAAGISMSAVLRNPKPMLLWAALIAGFMSLGLATMFVGCAVVFPLVGYATWHAFRDVIPDCSRSYL